MSLIKKIIFKGYVIFLMIITVLYGRFMFPLIFGFDEGKQEAAAAFRSAGQTEEERMFDQLIEEQEVRSKTDLGYRVIEQPYIEGRFHNIGFSIQKDEASVCVRCHGNVPHDKSKEVRSFLNMHAFYLACETCHALPEEEQGSWRFSWYDKDTGLPTDNPRALVEIEDTFLKAENAREYPIYGNYGAKVAPGIFKNDQFEFLHGPKDMVFVERFIAEQDLLKAEQKSQMKRVIHKKVSKKPMQCEGCHTEDDAYLPLAQLGYPPSRLGELTATAAVGMINKYKEFYIPDFLKPGGVNK